jgi:hypothetical protein
MTDLIARLDAAIGGPDRRSKTGRVRKTTPTKIETALLVDAKAEIERLRGTLLAIRDWADERDHQGIVEKISRVLGNE